MYNTPGSTGLIGMGPLSKYWTKFINVDTDSVMYTISSDPLSNTTIPVKYTSKVSINPVISTFYKFKQSMVGIALPNIHASSMYELSTFDFGIVYYENGTASSDYFVPLTGVNTATSEG